jgi:hypothetical protein
MRAPGYFFAAAVVTCAIAASAQAVARPVSPSPGSTMTTTHPVFSWTLPADERGLSISIAHSPKINPDTNDFMPGELADTGQLAAGASKWTPTRPLPAAKYFWHVASTSGQGQPREFGQTSSFVIRPLIAKPSFVVKTYAGQRMLFVTTSWSANIRKVEFTATLYAGSKRLGAKKLVTDNFLIDGKKNDISTWIIPPTVKKGTRLRLVVKLSGEGGARAAATKSLRAP